MVLKIFVQCRAIAFIALLSAIAAASAAQDGTGDRAGKDQPGETKLLEYDLSAGRLRAKLIDSGQTGPHVAGSSAFASITITPQDPSLGKRGSTEAILYVEALNGKIKGITGPGVSADIAGGKGEAKVTGLRHDKAATVLVELLLKDTPGRALNSLDIRLKDSAGAESKTVRINWQVRDCAGNYYQALQEIASSGGSELNKIIAEIRKRDDAFPRQQIFKVNLGRSGRRSAGRCISYQREWDVYGYRWRRVCTKYSRAENAEVAVSPSELTSEEREILINAAAILRAGGADTKLGPRGNFGWVTGKVATDLRIYLTQKEHPAICTGAIQFVDYYVKHLSGFRQHLNAILSQTGKARGIAASKVDAVKARAASLPGGHPGIGLLPLRAVNAAPQAGDQSIRSLILSLAPYAGLGEEDIKAIAAAETELATLKAVKDAMSRSDDASLAKMTVPAFALIEAAYYLGLAEERYKKLQTTYIGALDGIRAAHDKHCVCTR